jgi:hypothetical protein
MSLTKLRLAGGRSAVVLGVACVLSLWAWPPASAAPPAPAAPLRISGPYVYENLDVYLVHGRDHLAGRKPVPLARALAENRVIVRETGSVSQLTIENLSDEEVYVQAGEIVKGGRQDRVLSMDLVLPPKSGRVDVGSFCVESGRWQKRGPEAADRFASSEASLAHKDLKMANYRGLQGEVWSNVQRVQEKLASNLGGEVRGAQSASSLQLTLENDRVRKGVEGYMRALAPLLEAHPDAVGYAFAIGGVLNSAELYGSPALFRELWPKLIRASAVEAVAERRNGAAHTPPGLDVVRGLLEKADEGAVSEKPATAGTRTIARETSSRVVIETQETARKDAWIHRSYLKK